MPDIDLPYAFDGRGRTAAPSGEDAHIRDLIELVLFTEPGERVNRPTFGSGLLGLVFEGSDAVLAGATRASVEASLQQWLGDLIQVQDIQVAAVDATLRVQVAYIVKRTQQAQVAVFTGGVG